jgi:hypothetical protein
MFSENDARAYSRQNVPGLARMLTTLNESELSQIITQHMRRQLTH